MNGSGMGAAWTVRPGVKGTATRPGGTGTATRLGGTDTASWPGGETGTATRTGGTSTATWPGGTDTASQPGGEVPGHRALSRGAGSWGAGPRGSRPQGLAPPLPSDPQATNLVSYPYVIDVGSIALKLCLDDGQAEEFRDPHGAYIRFFW